MRLWRIYRFVSYINRNKKKYLGYIETQTAVTGYVETKKQLFIWRFDLSKINEISRDAIAKKYLRQRLGVENRDILEVTHEGRDLLELHGIGFLIEILKRYYLLVVLVFGSASLVNVVNHFWHFIK